MNAPAPGSAAPALAAASALPLPLPIGPAPLVIDTNCVLDLWVFDDPRAGALRQALAQGGVRWLATAAMRDELARVLCYPQIACRLRPPARSAAQVLAAFDQWTQPVPPAARAPVRCRDPDDQIFIDLAVHWRATLLSKDARVTGLARRLRPLGVQVQSHWTADAPA